MAEVGGTFIVARVLDEVIFEHAHEDGGQEPSQQHDRYAAVDDREPVDLQTPLGSIPLAFCLGPLMRYTKTALQVRACASKVLSRISEQIHLLDTGTNQVSQS